MFSIRFVTVNPPTTLIIASTTAINARIPETAVAPPSYATLAPSKAPIIEIPEIAFAPLINGVCNVAGTFVINSKPRKIASTKSVMFPIKNSGVILVHLRVVFVLDAVPHFCR